MANIFGHEVDDLRIIRDAFPEGTPRRRMADALTRGGRAVEWNHDFTRRTFKSDAEALTAGVGLITNNLQAVQVESDEILRRMFNLGDLIPLNTNVPEGATSNSVNVINRYGKGKFINKDGSNVEIAQASADRVAYPILYGGIVANWSLQELRNSIFAGIPLSTETIASAVEACTYHMNEVGMVGDSQYEITGLLNSPDIPTYAGSVPNFLTASPDEIVKFIQVVIGALGASSNEVLYQKFRTSDMVVMLPTVAFDVVSETKYSDNADRTIGEFLAQRNPWTTRTGRPLQFRSMPEANEAGESGSARMVVYPKDSRVLEMDVAISPRVTQVVNKEYSVNTPYEYSISGLNVKRATLCSYADGILG